MHHQIYIILVPSIRNTCKDHMFYYNWVIPGDMFRPLKSLSSSAHIQNETRLSTPTQQRATPIIHRRTKGKNNCPVLTDSDKTYNSPCATHRSHTLYISHTCSLSHRKTNARGLHTRTHSKNPGGRPTPARNRSSED